jgi:hypothetical protein
MNVSKRLPGNGKESGKPLDKARRQPGKAQRKPSAANHRRVAQYADPDGKARRSPACTIC